MYDYELTERGKIVIAIVLVLLLLLVPSAILLFTAIANQPAHPPEYQGSEASQSPTPPTEITPPTVITESPLPPGGGLKPSQGPDTVDTAPADGGNGAEEQDPPQPPLFGPTGGDPSKGMLSFLFSADIQNALDDETLAMLGEFVGSPKNTEKNIVAVEMPQLSDEDANTLYFAIISAFGDLGVSEQRLAYITQPSETAQSPFEVSLSYIPRIVK